MRLAMHLVLRPCISLAWILFTKTTSERPKVVWTPQFLTLLTWKCVSRHNGVHFVDISTSKSDPPFVCFVMFCTFWLGNVLRATTACTLSTSQLPKVVCRWCVLYIWTWKCASCHNVVQFLISHLARWLRTRRFSEVTFRPSGAPNLSKNKVDRDFPTLSRTCIFLLLTLSLLWSSHFFSSPPWLFPPLLFHLSILSEVSLLNFLRISQLMRGPSYYHSHYK